MRTQFMNDPQAGAPWFEYFQVGGSRPMKQEICDFPFTIGRDDSADFRVDSSRVSRKHVAIERGEHGYVLRDLGSTNGTFVNGQRVAEVPLSDGDVLVIADFEMTFFTGNRAARVGATQVMTERACERFTDTVDLILEVRRLHELLTQCSLASLFQPIVELGSGEVFGFQALREKDQQFGPSRQAAGVVEAIECRLNERLNQQQRLLAAEQAAQLPRKAHLFFALEVSEVSADLVPASLGSLAGSVAGRHQLVVEIPETAVCDIPYYRQFHARLREVGVEVAYGNFCGGPNQVLDWRNVAPGYVKIAAPLTSGISRASGVWRTVKSIVGAAHELGCAVIAAGVDSQGDVDCLTELGCHYAQGDFLGRPEPIGSFLSERADIAHAGK
jgi:EAL domain-containing protein (putative c-di-GMP-specific phosphodiesterase class I)